MTMNKDTLGQAMHAAWNAQSVDQNSVNQLGDQMYDAMLAIAVEQNSDSNGNLGRERFREMARAILEDIFNATGTVALSRFKAVAEAIINHISANATIAPLSTLEVPNDGPAHIHSTTTLQSTGKIS
jgi:hypothetical protein